MKSNKSLSVILVLVMLAGIFNMPAGIFAQGEEKDSGSPCITLITPVITEGTAAFDVICENVDSGDWMCLYASSQTIGSAGHSGWIYAENGTVTFSTEKMSPDRYQGTPGGWPLKAGEWTVVLFDNNGYDVELDRAVLTVQEQESEDVAGSVYVSNKYGSDENDGLTAASPVKTIAHAINLIGTSNDGTVIVLDGTDAEGNAEYEVYTRGSDWANPVYGGTQNVLVYENVPAHTGTITYEGDAADSVICFGANHLELKGPTVFKNITLIEGYNTGKQVVSMGYDVAFEENVSYIRTKITSDAQTKPANEGLSGIGKLSVDVAGRYNVSNEGTISLGAGLYGDIAFGGWDGNCTISENQTVYVGKGAKIDNIKLRNNKDTWQAKDINIVIDGGTVGVISDIGTGSMSADSLQIIFNNGTSFEYKKTGIVLGEGEWIMNAEADDTGAKLDVTDTAGVFAVLGEKTAIAQNESGTAYVSENGYLTVPAGTYDVTFSEQSELNSITVKYDGVKAEGTYIKGTKIILPRLEDKISHTFGGWELNGEKYTAGTEFILPEDVDEVDFTSVWNIIQDLSVIYLDPANGSDVDDGSTEDKAVLTIDKAINLLNGFQTENKTIVVIGRLEAPAALPAHNDMITIMGDGTGNSHFCITSGSVLINGPTTFKNIDISVEISDKFIETGGKKLVFDNGVTVSTTERKINLHIGTYNADGGKEETEISSGLFGAIHVGAYYNMTESHKTEGVDFTINDGSIESITIGADGWLDTQMGVEFTEDVNITVNGGTVGKIIKQSKEQRAPVFDKNLQIILNNGVTTELSPDFDPNGGYWLMRSAAAGGSMLKATEIAGEFEVVGGLTAVATSADGTNTYISASGILAVPEPGEYNVTYTDVVYYTNSGTVVQFYQDYTIDFDDLRHLEYDNKLFVGWSDEEGNKVTETTFNAGDKLYAKYVDCSLEVGGDFSMAGVQIRTSGNPGLRFVVDKTDAITDALETVEYGTVIIPSQVLGTEQLELDRTYTYNGKSYDSMAVPAVLTFEDFGDRIYYTICVINLPQDYYRRQYTVRGYIKYIDFNGRNRVLYTDYYSSNLYAVAKVALEDESITGDERAYLESIKNYVDETLKQEYLNQNKIDIKGSSDDPNTWIYQLENSGVMIREVEIDSGTGGDAVEVVQLSDTHFNYCNERDMEEANPAVMSTWENRVAFRYPSTQTALNNSIEYASYSDQIVITGDAIDYLSWGCLELLYKYVWDPYPDTIIALGNHEPVRQMQGTVPDPSSLESRYQILQDNWKHDIYYTSKILTNDQGIEKVMIIQMDNSQNKYWDSQVPLLSADIETAREKQIPVLIFGHTPLSTRNPEDAEHYAIRINDGSGDPANFYTSFIGYSATGATKQIYDLITMNPDVVKGYFCGHWHCDYYTEIWSKNADGTDNPDVVIPQYVMTGSAYDKGHAIKITIK